MKRRSYSEKNKALKKTNFLTNIHFCEDENIFWNILQRFKQSKEKNFLKTSKKNFSNRNFCID